EHYPASNTDRGRWTPGTGRAISPAAVRRSAECCVPRQPNVEPVPRSARGGQRLRQGDRRAVERGDERGKLSKVGGRNGGNLGVRLGIARLAEEQLQWRARGEL